MPGASDAHEVRQFATDLEGAALRVFKQVPAVIKKGAVNVKTQMVKEMKGRKHFKGVAHSISFDLIDEGFGAEIGPVSEPGGKPGDLTSIAYFGGVFGGGGKAPDPQGALDAEAPRTMKAIADLAGEV